MEERTFNLVDAVAVLKRRRKWLWSVSGAILVIGIALVLFLPSIYRSHATVLIERQEIPADLVRSTVTSYADQRIQTISQRVLNTANLTRIIEEFDLYVDERAREPNEIVLEEMRLNIALDTISAEVVDPKSGRPTEATIAFSISFEDESPQKAQRVANELVSLFLNENIRSRKDSAMETTSFLDSEADSLRERVKELEEKIATFKDEHPDARPELEGLTRNLVDRTELQLSEVNRRIHETLQQKIYLEAELAQQDPVLRNSGPQGTSALEQLRLVESQLAAAEASYGEGHPDVIRLRKQSEAMRATADPEEARRLYETELADAEAELSQTLERYSASHPDTNTARKRVEMLRQKLDALPSAKEEAPSNPAYVALAARLEASNSQLASLESQREELSSRIDGHTRSLMLIPDAEAKFRALNRDYESALEKYREITAKQMEARLSQNLESERKGEKFTLIEPPLLPERPAKPNRPAILIIAMVFAVLGGLGAVGLIETLDDKVHGRADILQVLTAPPLATVPYIELSEPSSPTRRIAVPAIVVGLVGLFALVVVHIFVMPLDVLFYVLLRKAGL